MAFSFLAQRQTSVGIAGGFDVVVAPPEVTATVDWDRRG
jgi:hypothetical protein